MVNGYGTEWADYRRQVTPRGTLEGGEEEASYGIDLTEFVGSSDPARIQAMLPALIRGELTKDDRISDVYVSVSYTVDTAGLAYFTIVERVVTFEEGESFELTIGVSALSIELIGLTV